MLSIPITIMSSLAVLFSLQGGGDSVSNHENVVLWNSGTWPYAQRSWIALKEKDVPFEHRIIDLSNKPQDFLDKYDQASNGSGDRAKVPLLEHGGTLVRESVDVVKYIAQNVHGEVKDDKMYPLDDEERRKQIDKILDVWDQVVASYMGYLRAEDEQGVKSAERKFVASLEHLEAGLAKIETTGLFLSGSDIFSAAECIAAPWVLRFYTMLLPYFRGVEIQDLIPAHCKKVSEWLEAIKDRPSVLETSASSDDMIAAAKRFNFVTYITPGAPASKGSS